MFLLGSIFLRRLRPAIPDLGRVVVGKHSEQIRQKCEAINDMQHPIQRHLELARRCGPTDDLIVDRKVFEIEHCPSAALRATHVEIEGVGS